MTHILTHISNHQCNGQTDKKQNITSNNASMTAHTLQQPNVVYENSLEKLPFRSAGLPIKFKK